MSGELLSLKLYGNFSSVWEENLPRKLLANVYCASLFKAGSQALSWVSHQQTSLGLSYWIRPTVIHVLRLGPLFPIRNWDAVSKKKGEWLLGG